MQTARVPVKTFSGRNVETQKLAIFAEKDQAGKVFYKVEAQDVSQMVAVSFNYDLEDAIANYTKQVKELLELQTQELKKGDK